MDQKFWHDRWQNEDIGFHRNKVHGLLERYWSHLSLAQGSRIFVPLCGKSQDMVWLAERGHTVVGCEISEVAVDAFFANQRLSPTPQSRGHMTCKRGGPFEIWRGDFFDLPSHFIGDIAAIYDRAAVVAMPPEEQSTYAKRLRAFAQDRAVIFLISLSYDQTEISGPPFSIPPERIRDLFGADFDLDVLTHDNALAESENLRKRGLTALTESLYILRARTQSSPTAAA